MSVTITIKGNIDYCQQSGQLRMRTEECYCTSKLLGQSPDKNCQNCFGAGSYQRTIVPYELKLSTANFEALWRVLGLAEDGEWIDARTLRKVLKLVDIEDFKEDSSPENAGHLVRHISRERALNYLDSLEVLCDVAEKRESPIVW